MLFQCGGSHVLEVSAGFCILRIYIESYVLLFCRHALFCVLPAKLPLPFAPVTCPQKKGVGGTRAVALLIMHRYL